MESVVNKKFSYHKLSKTETLFNKLKDLGVDPVRVFSLQIQFGHGGISICLTVSKIINEFNSSSDIEDEVSKIIEIILYRHFKKN